MWTMVALVIVQVVLLVLFAPIKVGAIGYFCLERENCMVDLKIFALTVAKIRIARENGVFVLKINEKSVDLKQSAKSKKHVLKAIKYISSGNLAASGDVLAVLGDVEAKTLALISGAAMAICGALKTHLCVYNDFEHERADAQLSFKTRISIFQALEMLNG